MRLLVIDGNSILNRAFYGIRLLSNKKGQFTNAIMGFINIYIKNASEVKPDGVAVAFDLKAPTFRHKAYDKYKAGRKGMPEELFTQLEPTKRLISMLGMTVIECEGFEADDILGTLADACDKSGNECFLLTGDRDSFQLVSKTTTVRLASTKDITVYTPEKIREVYGVEPLDMIEVKALMGDSSDNIPGVPGIGEKTALSLISEHKTLENIYDNIDSIKLTPSVKTKLINGKESAFMSRMLATICKDVPINRDISSYCNTSADKEGAAALLRELEMFGTIEKLGLSQLEISSDKKAAIPEAPKETGVLDISLFGDENEKADIILENDILKILLNDKIYFTSSKEESLAVLKSKAKKRTLDAKAIHRFAMENGSCANNIVFDATLAAYLIDSVSNDYSLTRLFEQYSVNPPDGENGNIEAFGKLCDILEAKIEDMQMLPLLSNIELPLAEVLSSMEQNGFLLDSKGITSFGEKIKADIAKIESEIYRLAGREFNISSPKQLAAVLFEDLGLPARKKTKSGYSTNAEVLESLRRYHPIIDLVLEYRKLTKLNSTYVEGLLKVVGEDGRVHSFFKQTETRTGRISSTEPNLQNIPVRTELGRNMRKFFIAKKGCVLLDADYSQIELRVLAHIANDKRMIEAFENGDDIHAITASQVFDMPLAFVDSSMRSAAKAVNFGIVYGIGAYSLSQDIGVSVAEADRYIKQYLEKYSGVKEYMDKIVRDGAENGYVCTLFGRRRYIPELNSSNKIQKALGARIAMNTPIQGTAADIIKLAMVNVYRKLKEENLDAKLILQVHDELIVEASEKDAERAAKILHEQMENAANLSVKLIAEVGKGKSWYEAH